MNLNRHIIRASVLGLAACSMLHAQEAALPPDGQEQEGTDGAKRVQYQLVRPDEKSPETVKPEENNPFESEAEANARNSPGDTEENRVRDKLLSLPIGGRKIGKTGNIELIMLGDIILRPGARVPALFPGQQVELKVKTITFEFIELLWQDREATGLPPKPMLIPIDIDPSIREVMPGSSGSDRNTQKRKFDELQRRNGFQQQPAPTPAAPSRQSSPPAAIPVEEDGAAAKPSARSAAPATPPPPAPSSSADELSKGAMRMLFGTPTPPATPK
ncbi:MAG: hypothetical protein RLZZ476_1253 [Verrucomicrobiota bacterium]|jgi:hypothetical protein